MGLFPAHGIASQGEWSQSFKIRTSALGASPRKGSQPHADHGLPECILRQRRLVVREVPIIAVKNPGNYPGAGHLRNAHPESIIACRKSAPIAK
jgi:hypothetical protein